MLENIDFTGGCGILERLNTAAGYENLSDFEGCSVEGYILKLIPSISVVNIGKSDIP